MTDDLILDPATTALVSIDMQNGVASHAAVPHTADEVVDRVGQLGDAVRSGGGLVVFVRTSFLPDETDSLHPPIDAPRGAPSRPAGWDQIVERLAPRPTEPIVTKRSFNAFHGSDLDLQLRRHGITTVVMAGISTNFGVEGTARAAYDHGYSVVFAEDAMATSSLAMHEGSLANVFPYIGRIRPVATIIDALAAVPVQV